MQIFSVLFLALTGWMVLFITPFACGGPHCRAYEKIMTGPSSERLNKLFDLVWTLSLKENPTLATYLGEKGDHGSWQDESLNAIRQRKEDLICPYRALMKIHRRALTSKERTLYDLFLESVNQSLKGRQFPSEYLALSSWRGVHQFLAEEIQLFPKQTLADYKNLLSRLKKASQLIKQNQILLKEGLKHKVTYPKVALQKIPDQLEKLLSSELEKSLFYEPFITFPASFSETSKEKLKNEAKQILSQSLLPALVNFQNFILEDYLPNANESTAFSDLPRGEEWYSHLIEEQTSLAVSPTSIHQIGLDEVSRIEKKIQALSEKSNYQDLDHFKKSLQDSRYFLSTPEEIVSKYRNLAKIIDEKLPKYFSFLPRNTYGIEAVPIFQENSSPSAYYMPGSLRSGKPGLFFVNTSRPKERPTWEMESYLLHEGVPGHHLQMSLAYENDRPKILRYSTDLAFVEGWALYAETLGNEMGIYPTLESQFGQLNQELWRATRLVVDTGLHHYRWPRSKAIQYFLEHTSKTKAEAEIEIDRYLTLPAQALTYKLGQLVFLEIRKEAESCLGDSFDLREFHQILLEEGSLPFSLLRKKMHAWIHSKKEPESSTHNQANKQD